MLKGGMTLAIIPRLYLVSKSFSAFAHRPIRMAVCFRFTDVFPFAQLTTLRDNLGAALALMFMVGFFWGVLKIWAGANAISKGDTEGKSGVIAGIIIAAAAAIMGVLYGIFGMQDSVITPRF
jgi:hypothetical protein